MEMVDSVDELKSSRSIASNNFPTFVILDAKIASYLNNKITQKSHFKRKVVSRNRKPRKRIGFYEEDRSLS